MMFANIKNRFQVFQNAFYYIDFKNRQGVSFADFARGIDGFCLKMSVQDIKSVYCYLIESDGSDINNALMNQKQFMKLQDEQNYRNIDPFELQVFQEQLSHKLQFENRQKSKLMEMDSISQASSNKYHGFKKAKQLSKKVRETNSLPKYIRDNINTVEFGVGTLPSDDMNMVMYNEFNHDYVRKMQER